MIIEYKGKTPKIAKSAFIAEGVVIIGDVEIGENSSVWFGSVLRGDEAPIRIGNNSNIQDNCTIHVSHDNPAIIGNNVSLGHNVVFHAATIDDNSLVGIGSIVLDGAHIRSNSIVGAGSVITGGKEFEEGSIIMGQPARVIGPIKEKHSERIKITAAAYIEKGKEYKK